MNANDRRLLDCHAAWVHGYMSTDELLHEAWLLNPHYDDDAGRMFRVAMVGLAAAARAREEKVFTEAFKKGLA